MSDELEILTKIYDTYTKSKESFIDRNFATNRYYLSMTVFLMLVTLVIYALTPSNFVLTTVGAIGLVTSALWWLSLDSYKVLIKIKYANVLERIEDRLPAKPCQDEFKATQELKKKHQIIFADLQKGFAFLILLIFTAVFFYGIGKSITSSLSYNSNPAPITEVHTENNGHEFPPVDVPEE